MWCIVSNRSGGWVYRRMMVMGRWWGIIVNCRSHRILRNQRSLSYRHNVLPQTKSNNHNKSNNISSNRKIVYFRRIRLSFNNHLSTGLSYRKSWGWVWLRSKRKRRLWRNCFGSIIVCSRWLAMLIMVWRYCNKCTGKWNQTHSVATLTSPSPHSLNSTSPTRTHANSSPSLH